MSTFSERAQELQSALGRTITHSSGVIAQAASWISRAVLGGHNILTCGNGGSAACAAHLTEELVGRFGTVRRPFGSICLNADAVSMSCIANDFGWDQVFARQLEAVGRPGDVLVTFSTSGGSPNLVQAVRRAVKHGLYCIHLGGDTPGPAGRESDIFVRVPSESAARVQEIHTLILHSFLESVEDLLDIASEPIPSQDD